MIVHKIEEYIPSETHVVEVKMLSGQKIEGPAITTSWRSPAALTRIDKRIGNPSISRLVGKRPLIWPAFRQHMGLQKVLRRFAAYFSTRQ